MIFSLVAIIRPNDKVTKHGRYHRVQIISLYQILFRVT